MNQSDNKIAKIFFVISATSFIIAMIFLIIGQKESIKYISFSESLKLKSEKMRIVELYNSFNPMNKGFHEVINSDTSLQNYILSNFEFIRIKTNDEKEMKLYKKYYGEGAPGLLMIFDKNLRPVTFSFPSSDSKTIRAIFDEILNINYIFDDEIEKAIEKSKANGKLTLLFISRQMNDSYGIYNLINKENAKQYIAQNFNLTLLADYYDKDKAKIQELSDKFNLSDVINNTEVGLFMILDGNMNLISVIDEKSDFYDNSGKKFVEKLQDAVSKSINNAK